MKKFLYALMLVLGVASVSTAAVKPPKDDRGITLPVVEFVGVKTCVINTSTGTNAVLCATGKGLAYGVLISSPISVADWVVLRDSATANTTSSSFTVVGTQPEGPAQVYAGASLMRKFPFPLQFTNGLSVNSVLSPQNGELWTILYRPLSATE